MIKSNCHTHTVYCDGKNTAREMVEAAIKKGFSSLGFSGHSPMCFENDWGMKKHKVNDYIKEIRALKDEYKDEIDILCGIEVDIDYCDVDLSVFDYTIGSVHQFHYGDDIYEIDLSADKLKEAVDRIFNGDVYKMCDRYYTLVADFICSNNFNVVGHFDLLTKFNEKTPIFDESDPMYQSYAINAIKRILNHNKNILFEVNTGAMYRKGNKRPYPAPFIMKYLYDNGAKITITSDAHCCEALDFAFEETASYCKSFGFKCSYVLTGTGEREIVL